MTVTKDFKFSPPSIESEVPCHLHFKLLPYTAAHHICVTNASTQEVVASSGALRAGDSFSTTLVEPGRYAFSSEAYPFMHGGVHAAACPSTSSSAASRLEAQPSVDCIKASSAGPELSPKTDGAAAASAAQQTGKPARRSASPSKGAAAGGASTVAGQHRQAHGDHDTLAGAGSDLATTTTATTAPAVVGAAGAAAGGTSSADAGVQAATALAPLTDRCRRSSCGSVSWDLLPQQPSEQAVLELVAAGAQRQHSLPATGRGFPGAGAGSNASAAGASILQQPQPSVEGSPTPSSCCDDSVSDHAETPTAAAAAAAGRASSAELFRSGPYRRRATAYDDDLDPPFHQAPTAELRDARAKLQQHEYSSSQQGGSRSLTANSSSNSGGGTAAGRQAAGEQQHRAACSMVRYAAGLEGLEISCSAVALPDHSSAAVLARSGSAGSSVLLGSCRSMQHNPLDSDAEPGTASAGFSDDEEVTEFLYEPLGTDTDEGGGCAPGPAAVGYKLMRSDSSQHTSEEEPGSPADSGREHQQQEQDWRPRQQELGSEHSQEDVISEAAHLLPAARCNGSGITGAGRHARLAWPSGSTGPAADYVLRSHSDESSDSDSGRDVRLRHAYGRGAAGGSSTNSSWLLGASRQQGQQHQSNGRHVEQLDSAAQTSPLHGGSIRMNQPPGSSWTLGGKQVASFSSSAGHTAVEDISARHNSSSSSRASTPAAGASAAAAAKRYTGSGSSTMLGPGTHTIGRGGQLPPIGSGLEAVTCSVADTAAVLQKHSLQAAQLPAKLPGAVADSACDSDGEPPSLAARLAQKQQQQKLVAANALAGSAAHSRTSSSGGSSAAGSALAAAAAAAAGQSQGAKKKKKGKTKADAAAVRAAAEARAAVEARRHDRDTVECALLDNRGSSSRGDSEVCC